MFEAKSRFSMIIALTAVFSAETGLAKGREIPFAEIWSDIRRNSPAERAMNESLEAESIAGARAGRHWFPQVYGELRGYNTNDPGTSLISKLGTRSIGGQDFSPFRMNNPDREWYGKATLGVSLSLYEGGAKAAVASSHEKNLAAKKDQKRAVVLSEYIEAASAYAMLLLLRDQGASLRPLQSLVESTIGRYELGASANPVGRSGLLGLRTLQHRIDGELAMVAARRKAVQRELETKTKTSLPQGWTPVEVEFQNFIAETLERPAAEASRTEQSASWMIEAKKKGAESMRELVGAERARFLPRVSLFSEGYLHTGAAGSGASYVAGATLQWDLFSAGNFGAIRQTRLAAQTMESEADAMQLRRTAELERVSLAASALVEQLTLAEKSLALMSQQSEISRKLFVNGAINALQLVEVFARRVDLVGARAQMQEQFLKLRGEALGQSSFEPSARNEDPS